MRKRAAAASKKKPAQLQGEEILRIERPPHNLKSDLPRMVRFAFAYNFSSPYVQVREFFLKEGQWIADKNHGVTIRVGEIAQWCEAIEAALDRFERHQEKLATRHAAATASPEPDSEDQMA